ncbi:hypothetical protein FRC03_011928 [Tulasnella sp. 419]|nr:hypothetical protein FRC03_011928 [Tulasnella sp. 419]
MYPQSQSKWNMPPIITTASSPSHPSFPDPYPVQSPFSPFSSTSDLDGLSPSSLTASSTYVGTYSSSSSMLPPSALTSFPPFVNEEQLHDEERDKTIGLGSLPDVPKRAKKHSITTLAKHAILGSRRGKLRSCEIRSEIIRRFPALKDDSKLSDKLRHDLSYYTNRFHRQPKDASDAGKGDYWTYIGDTSSSSRRMEPSRSRSPSQRPGEAGSPSHSRTRSQRGIHFPKMTPIKAVTDMTTRTNAPVQLTVNPSAIFQPQAASPIAIPGRSSQSRALDDSEFDTTPMAYGRTGLPPHPTTVHIVTDVGGLGSDWPIQAPYSYSPLHHHQYLTPSASAAYSHASITQISTVCLDNSAIFSQLAQPTSGAQPTLSQLHHPNDITHDDFFQKYTNIETEVEHFPTSQGYQGYSSLS